MKQDKDVVMFAVSAGGALMFASVLRGEDWTQAMAVGALTTCAVSAGVYGLALVGRPGVLTTLVQWRTVLPAGPGPARPAFRPAAPAQDRAKADITLSDRWRVALWQCLGAGRWAGSFSVRALTVDHHLMTDHGHEKFMRVLIDQEGVLSPYRTGTDFAAGWDHARAVCHVRRMVTFPEGEPPSVTW